MNREDFPMLNNGLIYLDNGATTFKPVTVVNAILDYYTKYTANAHRGDYDISFKVDQAYEGARKKVANFINADYEEVVFTSGTTDSLNMVANGFFRELLEPGDEVLITLSEMLSRLTHLLSPLPWKKSSLFSSKSINLLALLICSFGDK